ncbi:MAG: universal stress protein [Saprospiraceae bacterium]|nr:universal stress protein [Saprospiraceae bacterium]
MTTIKIFGAHDAKTRLLRENVALALSTFPMENRVEEISEPNKIRFNGVSLTPALMLDGEVVTEGQIPSVQEITEIFQNRYLLRSKIYRLRTITVPVDMSKPAEGALAFAWHLSQKFKAKLDIIYAMDSIFEGSLPSASGFLSGYKKTMETELEAFVRDTLKTIGVAYEPPSQRPPVPKTEEDETDGPGMTLNVLYGFPEAVIEERSKKSDLIVMGTTGRGGVGRELFGSVSSEVSRMAHCPVLFVPSEAEFRGFNNVLYASHFDSLDALRIKQAVTFAKRFGGRMHFVHAGPAGEKGLDLERKLFEVDYQHSSPEHPFLFSRMFGDDVVEQLNEYALFNNIDLIILVTHQRSFWESILHKSITRKALLGAGLPLLVMHSDDDMAK